MESFKPWRKAVVLMMKNGTKTYIQAAYDISEEKAEQTAKGFIEQFKKYELIVE